MRARVERRGSLEVALPPVEAFDLFTPEGERGWVEGWEPAYPAGDAASPGPGLTFVVGKAHGASTWVVTRFEPGEGATYAYVVSGHRATLVDVELEATGTGSRVRVTYVVTALAPEADGWVRAYGDAFDDMLAGWEADLAAYLENDGRPRGHA